MKTSIACIVIPIVVLAACTTKQDASIVPAKELSVAEVRALIYDETGTATESVVDIRTAEEYATSSLPGARNVPFESFLKSDGRIVNHGKALIRAVTDDSAPLIVYGDERAAAFARAAKKLNFEDTYYYTGGVQQWRESGGFLVIQYSAFKAWHEKHAPLSEGSNVLVDVNPAEWYAGVNTLRGHIPGAINIPVETLVENGGLVDRGRVVLENLPDKEAMIVVYNVGRVCPRSYDFIRALVALGYTNVYRFEIGYDIWVRNGNELETGGRALH